MDCADISSHRHQLARAFSSLAFMLYFIQTSTIVMPEEEGTRRFKRFEKHLNDAYVTVDHLLIFHSKNYWSHTLPWDDLARLGAALEYDPPKVTKDLRFLGTEIESTRVILEDVRDEWTKKFIKLNDSMPVLIAMIDISISHLENNHGFAKTLGDKSWRHSQE